MVVGRGDDRSGRCVCFRESVLAAMAGVVGVNVRESAVKAESLVAGVVSAIRAIMRTRVVCSRRGSDRGRVHGTHILAHLVIMALSLVVTGLRDLRRRCRSGKVFSRSGRHLVRLDTVEVIEFALADLLTDDIDVAREVDFLDRLAKETRQKTENDCNKANSPERQCSKDLRASSIEGEASSERSVGTGPEEDEKGGDDGNKTHEPVPAVSVHHEVGVDNNDSWDGNVDTQSLVVVDASAIPGDEVSDTEEQEGEVEADDTLVQAVDHVEPELDLSPFLSLDTATVKLGHGNGDLVVDVLVEDTHEDDQKRSEGQVVEQNVGVVKCIGAVEVGIDLVPEEGKRPDNVLEELSVQYE